MITARAFAGRRYAVLGLARSGLATCAALIASGAGVTAWDEREAARDAAMALGADIGNPMAIDLVGFAGVVVSPGVPLNRHPIADHAREAGVPILGDDWKSQIGATIIHRTLAKLFEDRGINIKKSYQLNYAGNTDFINLVMRGETKHVTKHDAISSILKKDTPIAPGFAFVDNQGDQKTARILIEGTKFGGAPVRMLIHLEVEDSPNSGGISIDAVRCCKLAMDRGMAGAIEAPSSYFFKHPPVQYPDDICHELVEEFIKG